MDNEYLKKLVIARLKTIPPNISFSIGSHGDFTRDQIINEVARGSDIGNEFTEMEIKLLLKSPKLVGWLSGKKTASD